MNYLKKLFKGMNLMKLLICQNSQFEAVTFVFGMFIYIYIYIYI